MTEFVNIYDAKTQLSRLVERAAAGENIVIARAGKPMARLVAFDDHDDQPRKSGQLKGLRFPDAAFFDPLPDDELDLWE